MTSKDYTSVGTVIAELREQLGWSQRELAEQAGIGKETVWKIENNQTRPSTRTLEKLAKALRIEVSEFYKYEAASFAERADFGKDLADFNSSLNASD